MPDITINGPDGNFSGYLAMPTSGAGGGILVIHEIFGVNSDMRAHCDHLANAGYFALCPDIFWRQEPGIQLTDQSDQEWARAFELYQGFNVEKGIVDLKASLAHLKAIDGSNGKLGTVGFCLGGLLVYLIAAQSDANCNVSYYGVGIEDQLEAASSIKNPTLLHIAEEDGFVSKEAQININEVLSNHGSIAIHNYPNVDHAFARHDGVNFNAAAAALAGKRTMACFAEYLS